MLILARHGNTFEAHERAVWVGAKTDLPLTADGLAQAESAAGYLVAHSLVPERVIAGPLQRTRAFAAVIADRFGLRPEIDARLKELDYGAWEGLDAAEVAARFGEADLFAWEERLIWPADGHWGEGRAAVEQRVDAVLEDLRAAARDRTVLAVTSNGILRFVRWMVSGDRASRETKVRTGALCLLRPADQGWAVDGWDIRP